MIDWTPEDQKEIWTSIFRRKGGNGAFTGLFDELPVSVQDNLRSKLTIRRSEELVIGGYENSEDWLILTTSRLVWSVSGKQNEIDIGLIDDAIADFRALQRSGKSKQELDELQISTFGTDTFAIRMEAGPPLLGIWNVLKNAGARNARQQRQ